MASNSAEILSTQTATLFATAVQRAADLLRAGEVVALPTETVYGLAANALDPRAVARIFSIKGRPAHNPLIVHVASLAMARQCSSAWPEAADALAAAFWPGPLTLVVPCTPQIPELVTAGGNTVGVRWPSHPFIQAVIRACGFPLAAPSANVSNHLSPTNADHVAACLGTRIPLIVDGGQSQVGIESTVLDVTGHPARILRPGMIHEESLEAVLGGGGVVGPGADPDPALGPGPRRSPGQLAKHYAPQAALRMLRWRDEADLEAQVGRANLAKSQTCIVAHTHIPTGGGWSRVSVVPHDPEAFARAWYAELHHCDATGAACIVVEALPDAPEWRAIADRLQRASA